MRRKAPSHLYFPMKMEKNAMPCIITSTLFLTLIFNLPASITSKRDAGFMSPLIHRSSPESPFYDPNASPASLQRADLRASRARSRYFVQRASFQRLKARGGGGGGGFSRTLSKAPIYPFGPYTEYVMKVSIGTPRQETYWVPDTGSDLTWLQCEPCKHCYRQITPLYDPKISRTYTTVLCETDECGKVHGSGCHDETPECSYEVTYEDGSISIGTVAKETMMFLNEGGTINYTNMLFGCGHESRGFWDSPMPAGLAGMNRESISLVSQLKESRFSYCMSSNKNSSIGHSMLRFGMLAVVPREGTTPLLVKQSLQYDVQVEDISVAGVPLNIPEWVFDSDEYGSRGFIIDTGTTYTMLDPTAHRAVVDAVKKFMKDKHGRDPAPESSSSMVCYTDVSDGPAITILFKGLPFEISQKNTWEYYYPDLYCLAIHSGDAVSILGVYQQRDVNIGYDLDYNFVSLRDADCPLEPDGFSNINNV